MLELNKIFNMNCSDGIKLIDDNSIDLAIYDPPFTDVVDADWDKGENPFNLELINETYRALKPTGSFYIWCGIGEKSQSLIEFFNLMKQSKFYFKDLITWKKQRGIGMRKGWLYTREECMWFVKDNKQFIWNKEEQYHDFCNDSNISRDYMKKTGHGARITNVWIDITECSLRGSKNCKQVEGHITPKPLEAIDRIIKLHTKENAVILDCFMGSGTTAVATIGAGENRKFIGFELDERYYKLAVNRINGYIY